MVGCQDTSDDDEEVLDEALQDMLAVCDELALSRFPPATLAWLPSYDNAKRLLHHTLVYEIKWTCPEREKVVLLQLRRLLSSTFPFYLPQRYHSMDCKSMMESSVGGRHQYLPNVSQFVVFSQVYSVGFWRHVEDLLNRAFQEPNLTTHLSQQIFHKSSLQFGAFNKGAKDLHQCLYPEDFLTNEWVLVQLPWHPVLFHQWLVAALSQVLLAQKALALFEKWPVPPSLSQRVQRLMEKVQTLHALVITGLNLLGCQVSTWPEADVRMSGHILHTVVLAAMPLLHFFLDSDIMSVVASLKLLAWPGHKDQEKAVLSVEAFSFCCKHETFYGSRFNEPKQFPGARRLLFNQDVICRNSNIVGGNGEYVSKLDTVVDSLKRYSPNVQLEDSTKHYHEAESTDFSEFVQSVWTQLETEIREFVSGVVDKYLVPEEEGAKIEIPWEEGHLYLSNVYVGYMYDLREIRQGVDKSDLGAIHCINMMEAEVEIENVEASMAGYVQFLLQKIGFRTYLRYKCLCKRCGSAIVESLTEIEPALDKETPDWTVDTLKQKFDPKIREKVVIQEEIGAQGKFSKIMESFELRIKKLVFSMFEESLKASDSEEEAFTFPEWQFVQYILPCFVTLIGDLARAKVKQAELSLFIKLVHTLIQTYETHLDRQLLQRQGASEETPPWLAKNRIQSLSPKMKVVLSDLGYLVHGIADQKKGLVHSILENNLFVFFLDIVECVQKSQNPSEDALLMDHCLQVEKFLSRLHTSVQKVEVSRNQNTPAATMLANMMQVYFVLQELLGVITLSQKHFALDEVSSFIFEYVDFKIKSLSGKKVEVPKINSDMKRKLQAELRNLLVQQMLGILLHHCVLQLKKCQAQIRNRFLQTDPGAKSPLINRVFAICQKQKWHKLKLMLVPLQTDQKGTDLSLVPLDTARKWPLCYKTALSKVEASKDKRLERQLLPLLYCRGCNMFEGALSKCKLCEGLEVLDFPDIHWFCSSECEDKEDGHKLEHSQHQMSRLGLSEI